MKGDSEGQLSSAHSGKQPSCIVSLLASAGGLAPIQTILENTANNSGAAFFVLQHLASDNENMLPDLLQKHCSMTVFSAADGQEIKANTVYVSPPGHYVTISKGFIKLQSLQNMEIRNQAFNTFLESLALDQETKAIAVVLSGACDDGRLGALMVRQAGGLVIVQDPDTADFRSMPDRVIEMSAADIILVPDKIAPMLAALIKDSQKGISFDAESSGYLRIMERLREISHIDFSRYKLTTIKRRIVRRMLLNKLGQDVDAYINLIESSEDEVKLLGCDLLIGVSSFFRDNGAFEALKSKILPRLIHEAQGRELRIWVAGCATGEEAYSFAILCLDYFQAQGLTQEVKILASDINPESIRKANLGIFSKKQVESLPPKTIKKYFHKLESGFQVSEALKKNVIFFKHDLTEDIPFSNVDLISCRNVFIYLKPEIQQHIIRCFGFGLKTGGVLMLSPSETLSSQSNFELVNDHWRMYELMTKPRFFASSLPGWRLAMDQSYTGGGTKKVNADRAYSDDVVRERLLQLLSGRYLPLVLVVSLEGEIVYVLGDSSGLLHFPSGEPVNDLSRLTDPNLRLTVSMGLKNLELKNEPLLFSQLPIQVGKAHHLIDLRMHKLQGVHNQSDLVAVLFENVADNSDLDVDASNKVNIDHMTQQRIGDLEEELYFTKQNLRTAVEELEATNEELQSANEEMQSGNEELQSTNEELQSTNEQLLVLNTEYQKKADELAALNDDVSNLMLSSNVLTLFVDEHKKIRQISPSACKVLHLSPDHIGQPIDTISPKLKTKNISDIVDQVLQTGVATEIEDSLINDNIYIIRTNPFLTATGDISGTTITLLDITTIRQIAAEKEKLAAVVTHCLDPIIIHSLEGDIVFWNKGAETTYGYTETEACQLKTEELVPYSHIKTMKFYLAETLKGKNLGALESKRLTKEGKELTVSLTCTVLFDSLGKPYAIATTEHDITEQFVLAEEARLAAVAFQTIDSIMITNKKGKIVRVNKSFSDITGYSEAEALNQKPSLLHSGMHDEDFYAAMWDDIVSKGTWAGDIWNKKKNGNVFPCWLSINTVRDKNDKITHYIGIFRDISEKKQHEDNIHRLAFYDPLTELPNRRLYSEKIKKSISLCQRLKVYGALMFIDLDRFKTINDSLGHSIGDKLLVAVSKRLSSVLREEDFLARLGGDEFLLITTELGINLSNAVKNAEKFAQKVIAMFDKPFSIDGHELNTSPSIGVAIFPNEEDNEEDLLRQADNAMYLAKKMGRNTVRFFNPSLQAEADKWLEMEKALRQAMKENQFVLHYQPQFNSCGESYAVEALVRWESPEKGLVPPNDFLPICEDTGLILELGNWVLKESCQQMSEWKKLDSSISTMSINVSASQFMNPEFESEILAALKAPGLSPEMIELEVTESLLLNNIEDVSAIMSRLKKIGVRFSIDDYGTGYSSLAYIKKLPINKIKIDQTFVRDVLIDKDDACIVESTIMMAKRMGLDIISEGVETKEQMDFLENLGCTHFQGFLFSKGVPADEVLSIMDKQKKTFNKAD